MTETAAVAAPAWVWVAVALFALGFSVLGILVLQGRAAGMAAAVAFVVAVYASVLVLSAFGAIVLEDLVSLVSAWFASFGAIFL